MKALLILCLVASIAPPLRSEVLIIAAGLGGKLSVATGEVAIVSRYQKSLGASQFPSEIVAGGVTNTLPLALSISDYISDKPAAFAGPMEIVFKTSASHLVSYRRSRGARSNHRF